MNKFEIRTQHKKDAIISAAMELFRDKGYTHTGIGEIARKAEVSPASIYNYFGGKQVLMEKCVSRLLNELLAQVNDVLTSDAPFQDKLGQAVLLCTEQPHDILENYFSADEGEDHIFKELLRQTANLIRVDILTSFIEEGKKEGAIDSDISTETISEFLNLVYTLQTSWEVNANTDKKISELYRLVLYGLIGHN